MKKIVILAMMSLLILKVEAKCDWSKAGFYFTNKCRTYTFELGSYINSCVKYTTYRINLKTKRTDTIYGRVFTTTFGVQEHTIRI